MVDSIPEELCSLVVISKDLDKKVNLTKFSGLMLMKMKPFSRFGKKSNILSYFSDALLEYAYTGISLGKSLLSYNKNLTNLAYWN